RQEPDPGQVRHQPGWPAFGLCRRPHRRRSNRRRIPYRGCHECGRGRGTIHGAAALDGVVRSSAMTTNVSEKLHGAAQRFVLCDVDWEGYRSLLNILGDRPVRVTYDRGTLELMTPLPIHERYKSLFGRLIEMLTEELDLDLYSFGSTTLGREVINRGLEPDECFYISSARKIRDSKNIDLEFDPPPDLAIEIDITGNSGRRLSIYGVLKIPEVWQFDGEIL